MFQAQGMLTQDSLRAVLDSTFSASAYQWVERPNLLRPLQLWWNRLISWLSGLSERAPGLYWLLIVALSVLLVAIVVHAVWVVVQTMRAAGAPEGGHDEPSTPELRGASWYRQQARRLAAEGRYVEAMQADFLGLVLELDQLGALQFHPSKTPYEYSAEVKGGAPVRAALRELAGSLYHYAFAREPCGQDDF